MKHLVKLILLPLLLTQSAVVAQTDLSGAIETPAPPAVISETSTVRLQPTLIPLRGTDQIQLQLVNCGRGLDCALASFLLPKSTRIDQLQLQFDNPAPVSAKILNTATVVRGNFNRLYRQLAR